MNTKIHKTNALREALFNANKMVCTIAGETRKLDCRAVLNVYTGTELFVCDAGILNPSNPNEAHYRYLDLWRSESDLAQRFLAEFARMGGWEAV